MLVVNEATRVSFIGKCIMDVVSHSSYNGFDGLILKEEEYKREIDIDEPKEVILQMFDGNVEMHEDKDYKEGYLKAKTTYVCWLGSIGDVNSVYTTPILIVQGRKPVEVKRGKFYEFDAAKHHGVMATGINVYLVVWK
jgi:hypothetical protein